MNASILYGIGLMAVPILLALTLHEWGHARMALAFGDHTAEAMGRVSLNPLVHLDPLGTLMLLFGPIGWAKPVPVNPANLRPARLGDICVSLAGVSMNLLLAGVLAGALCIMAAAGVTVNPNGDELARLPGIAAFMLSFGVLINLCLMTFNLIPLFPLDGHHVIRELLPRRHQAGFMEFQRRYGRFLLIGLIAIPWIAGKFGRDVINPLGALMARVIIPIEEVLLTDSAMRLLDDAWYHYGHFLTWR